MSASEDFASLHEELRAVARDLLGKSDTAVDWPLIARSGWLGLEAPASVDGAEATFAETAVILTELGRAAARGPYPSVALSVFALRRLGLDDLLRATVAGETIPVVALSAESTDTPFRLDGGLLTGEAPFVLDAPAADRLLVPAVAADGSTVLADVVGATVTEQPVLDATRTLGRVTAEGLRPAAIWPADRLPGLRDRAAVSIACDSLGVSEAMLDATVAYAGVREQFGRKIGSFQAVQHACADMLVRVTLARKLVAAAVHAVATDAPDAATAVSMAKSYATSAAVEVAGKAMQLHGGMGYTWESGVHVYLKRAALNRSLFGSPAHHRRELAKRYA